MSMNWLLLACLKNAEFFFFSWKKSISVTLNWFIWGIKGNFECKYKWEHEKKSPFPLKCLSTFTFLFLGMNNPQAFMSTVSYFCPDVTHSLFLHCFFPPVLFQRDKWQLSLSLLRSQPFPQELGCDSSLVLRISTFRFLLHFTFALRVHFPEFLWIVYLVSLSLCVWAGHSHSVELSSTQPQLTPSGGMGTEYSSFQNKRKRVGLFLS